MVDVRLWRRAGTIRYNTGEARDCMQKEHRDRS